MTRGAPARLVGVLFAALCVLSVTPRAAPQTAKPERFTALALPPVGSGRATPVDIVIERWSTAVENDGVMTALVELGTKGVLQALLKLPRVGSFAVEGALGYPVRYAWKTTGPDGIARITLATDRYVSLRELSAQSRSLDYPITLIELRVKPSGDGDGQVAVAAQLSMDRTTKAIIVENYDIEPVRLTAVKRLR